MARWKQWVLDLTDVTANLKSNVSNGTSLAQRVSGVRIDCQYAGRIQTIGGARVVCDSNSRLFYSEIECFIESRPNLVRTNKR
jgi:hypothetical protein